VIQTKTVQIKQPTLKTIWRLLGFLKPYRALVFLAFLMLVVSTILSLVSPMLVKDAIDTYILNEDFAGLPKLALLVLVVTVTQSVLSALLRLLTEYISQNTVHKLRKKLYQHISNLSIGFFDFARTGDLMSRITSDTNVIGRLYGFATITMLVNFLTLIGIFAVVTYWEPVLGLIYLFILPFAYIAMRAYALKVRPLWRRNREASGEITSIMQEVVTSIRVVKLFGKEEDELERFRKKNIEVRDIHINTSKISAFWMPYIAFLTSVASAVVLLIGGYLVLESKLTIGTLIAFTTYLGYLARPIRQTGHLINLAQSSATAGDRIFELLDTKSHVIEKEDAIYVPEVHGDLSFKDVSFSYSRKDPTIKNVSFDIRAGENIAVVGPTGAGKSTLISLIPRFYDPDSGSILLDGIDIREYKLKSLRAKIGYVLQDTFLFDGTIKDNIAYGKPEASFEEVKNAAIAAEIDEYIMSLPNQYDTEIGERGVRLSGGQRQRIAIARVLLVDPPILILDEPTANVDANTEARLQNALFNVTKGRTTIIIAHRLWAIRNADKIAVIEKGLLTQFGTHEELISVRGFYRDATEKQALAGKESV